MSRRNRSRAAFSLFSFQDIITAVTAIVMLLVLILTLELITRRQHATAADPGVGREALEETIAALEALVGRLSAAALDGAIRPLVSRTREEVERDVRIVRDQGARATERAAATRLDEQRAREMAAAEAARLTAAATTGTAAARLAGQAAEMESEAAKLTRRNRELAERLAAKPDEAGKNDLPGAEIVFNAAGEFDRQAWIVELSAAGVAAVRLGTGWRQELGRDAKPGAPLFRWLAGLDRRQDHALVLVRPSGIGDLEDVLALLADAGIPFGIDLIGEDQAVRDGKGESRAVEGDG